MQALGRSRILRGCRFIGNVILAVAKEGLLVWWRWNKVVACLILSGTVCCCRIDADCTREADFRANWRWGQGGGAR